MASIWRKLRAFRGRRRRKRWFVSIPEGVTDPQKFADGKLRKIIDTIDAKRSALPRHTVVSRAAWFCASLWSEEFSRLVDWCGDNA